jgi:hypothetical protein
LRPSVTVHIASEVRRRIAIFSLFFAWLCANGAIWDVVQLVAWTKMFSSYAESLPVGEALRETFDASKPCDLCLAIAHAKESDQKQSPQQLEPGTQKLTLAFDSPAAIFLTKPSADWPAARWTMHDPRVEPVPLPPPRV